MKPAQLFRVGVIALLTVLCGRLIAAPPATAPATTQAAQPIHWEKWSDDVFARAKKEHRFVLLDLEAVWCHWCHVMDENTYSDPDVQRLMGDKYIAVRVDQDSRPDLSNRYEDYGWPATVVFNADGGEIVKRQGYIPPVPMARLLQAIIDDPTPGPSVKAETEIHIPNAAALAPELRDKLIAALRDAYDPANGGWGTIHKFVDADVVEYCMISTDDKLRQMARQTLTANLKLIDPVWGGVYQYSTDGDWDHAHFEKIMSYQADDLRIYALAYVKWHDAADLKAAQDIHRYLEAFLTSPDGAFYTSQDADLSPSELGEEYYKLDDAARRKLGIPRVDTHIYARENGWAINALIELYCVSGDEATLNEAIRAANWVIANRSLDGGGFRHDSTDATGPYLGDTLAMGRAFLSLYAATADRAWLKRAEEAATYIGQHFAQQPAGFTTAAVHPGEPAARPELDENVMLARFANLLAAYTGQTSEHQMAESATRYLATPEIAGKRHWLVGGILLTDRELTSPPLHVTIVGPKKDLAAKALFQAALRCPVSYRRIEWYDRGEGALPNMDVEYPTLAKPSAFLCTGNACSLPMSSEEKLLQKLGVSAAGQ